MHNELSWTIPTGISSSTSALQPAICLYGENRSPSAITVPIALLYAVFYNPPEFFCIFLFFQYLVFTFRCFSSLFGRYEQIDMAPLLEVVFILKLLICLLYLCDLLLKFPNNHFFNRTVTAKNITESSFFLFNATFPEFKMTYQF